jgi:hypothetical protein
VDRPLQSLYAEFFPSVLDEALFARLAGRRADGQDLTGVNFWRATDPIAFAISGPSEGRLLPDPLHEDADAKGLSDYWVDPEQQTEIRDVLVRSGEDHGRATPE